MIIMRTVSGTNLKMSKLYLFIFIILFSLKTSISYSNNIKDFTLEGMSIGDSTLDFFTEREILSNKMDYYKKDDFITIGLNNHPSLKQYEWLQISYKKNDKRYLVESLDGVLSFRNDYNSCLKKKQKIVSEIKEMTGAEPTELEGKHGADPLGKSIFSNSEFDLSNGLIVISCINWSKKMEEQYFDHLKVWFGTSQFYSWIQSNPYK